jgi:hypothetical protein
LLFGKSIAARRVDLGAWLVVSPGRSAWLGGRVALRLEST